MTVFNNSCEGQTSGTALTTTNSANGGDAVGIVTGTWQFDTLGKAHGTTGWRCVQGSAAGWRTYWIFSATTQVSIRFYITMNTIATSRQLATFIQTGTFNPIAHLVLDGSNKLVVQDAANGPLFTSTAALTAATTYRVEMQVDTGSASNNGTIAMQYFAGDSTTAIQSFPGTGVNAGSGVSLVRFQLGNNDVVTIDTTFDDIRISSGSMTPIGPYSPTTIYTINDSIGITDTGTAAFAQITQTLTPEAIGITDSIVVHYSTPPPAELKTTTDYEYGFLSGFTTKDTMIDRYMKGPFPDLQYMGFGAAVITHYGLQGMTVAEALRYYYGATSTETLADARIRFFKTYYGIPT